MSLIGIIGQVFSGLRFRLLLLIALVCAPLIVLMLHTADEDRRRAIAGWRQRSQRVLQAARHEEQDVVAGTRQLLLALSESSPVRSLDAARCRRWLAELGTIYPRYATLGVLTTNGTLLAITGGATQSRTGNEPDFFRRAIETRSFSIGEVSTQPAEHRATVSFGYPVLDASGEVLAVVFAELNLNRLMAGPELQSLLTRGAIWTEIARNGVILARYPKPEEWVGRRLDNAALSSFVLNHGAGATEARDADGIRRFYAFGSRRSRFSSEEVLTLLGVPKQNLFMEADRNLLQNLGWLAATAGLALILGWFGSRFLIIQPVRALAKSTARLAAGDLTVRTGVPHSRDELGQLTLAFDQMAQALEDRERERERASHKLQVLSHRLVKVQETERRHIARELHDEIGQSLTAAEMNLQAALRSPGAATLERRLEESIQAVERVLEQVHDLSLNLRPSMLDDLGLEPALRWYTHRQAALTGMKAEFRPAHLLERLDPMIETECFRVAQEALTNAVRHSKASAVTVELSRVDGHLHLMVRDDGIGFDVSEQRGEAVRGTSLGLLSMEERAALAGGGLELNSLPGRGTEVHAWFPLTVQNTLTLAIADEPNA